MATRIEPHGHWGPRRGVSFEFKGEALKQWGTELLESVREFLTVAANPRLMTGRLMWFLVLGGIFVESLLAFRLWTQIRGQDVSSGLSGLAFEMSGFFVSPFRELEPTQPIKETGIIEFATLVAMEAYLIVAVGGLVLLFLTPRLVRFLNGIPAHPETETQATVAPALRPSRLSKSS
jgi:hypothetical protein